MHVSRASATVSSTPLPLLVTINVPIKLTRSEEVVTADHIARLLYALDAVKGSLLALLAFNVTSSGRDTYHRSPALLANRLRPVVSGNPSFCGQKAAVVTAVVLAIGRFH